MGNDTTGRPFFSSTEADLQCDKCGDISLYHDSFAWAHADTKELLCDKCYAERQDTNGFLAVITYH